MVDEAQRVTCSRSLYCRHVIGSLAGKRPCHVVGGCGVNPLSARQATTKTQANHADGIRMLAYIPEDLKSHQI
jgi:hypothetical protein